MKNNNTQDDTTTGCFSAHRVTNRARLTASALLVSLALLTSCDGQGKDSHSAVPRVDAAEQDDHSQEDGHAHAAEGESEHADEVMLTSEAVTRYGIKTQAAQLWVLRPTITAPARVGFNTEAMAHVGSPLRGRIAGRELTAG